MPDDVADLLARHRGGDAQALAAIVTLLYPDLRRISHSLRRHNPQGTLGTTGVVHEAWERLERQHSLDATDRGHFLAVCAMVMRRVLVDEARARRADKRGGGVPPVTMPSGLGHDPDLVGVLALDEALIALRAQSERALRVVECRIFAELTIEETAQALGLSTGTVKREWRLARAWLRLHLEA